VQTRAESWDSFWGRLLRIDAFAGRWVEYRQLAAARAAWLTETFALPPGCSVLSLGCGEGGHELALARRGFAVTGVDRNAVLVAHAAAAAAAEGLPARFAVLDLRQAFPAARDCAVVVCFDMLGLMGRAADTAMLGAAAQALAPGGLLLADIPTEDGLSPGRTWSELAEGYLLLHTAYDPPGRLLSIDPLYIDGAGRAVVLEDAYDAGAAPHRGVRRYLYEPGELAALLEGCGLAAEVVPHQRAGYALVAGRRS
jgi:SAM-dependent methyltransferase